MSIPSVVTRHLMRYFDTVADSSFRATRDGGVAFFPCGLLGPGYTLASTERLRRVREQHRRFTAMAIALGMTGVLWRPVLLYGSPIFLVAWGIWFVRLLPGLTLVSGRNTIAGIHGNQAIGLRLAVSILLSMVAVFLTVGGIATALENGPELLRLGLVALTGSAALWFLGITLMNLHALWRRTEQASRSAAS